MSLSLTVAARQLDVSDVRAKHADGFANHGMVLDGSSCFRQLAFATFGLDRGNGTSPDRGPRRSVDSHQRRGRKMLADDFGQGAESLRRACALDDERRR